jgi:hypothetical protein
VNIQVNAEWVELRTLIVSALDQHPAAKADVMAAMRRGGGFA